MILRGPTGLVVGLPATETETAVGTETGTGTVRGKDGQGAGAQEGTTASEPFSDTPSHRTDARSAPGQHNPGNNLHVSGLSHKVDSRDLESAFLKIGRVRSSILLLNIC